MVTMRTTSRSFSPSNLRSNKSVVVVATLPPPTRKKERLTQQVALLRTYNNKHKGQRGFLVGGGSSLATLVQEGFNFREFDKEIIVGVNKAYKLVLPTYLVFGDAFFLKYFYDEISAVPCIKFAPQDILRGISDTTIVPLRRGTNYKDVLPTSIDGAVSFINNSGVAALRIMYCLGCNPIYLLGIDLNSNPITGETHFHQDYTSAGRSVHPLRYNQFYVEFARTLSALKTRDVSVFSCSPISSLNTIIPYIPIMSLFP